MNQDDEKLDDLTARIKNAQAKPDGKSEAPSAGRNVGFDFVGSVVGCGIVGALADRAFSTGPWCLLAMVLAGFALGIATAWRALQKPEN